LSRVLDFSFSCCSASYREDLNWSSWDFSPATSSDFWVWIEASLSFNFAMSDVKVEEDVVI